MKNIKLVAASFFLIFTIVFLGSGVARASVQGFCPGTSNLHGWWASFTPSTRVCPTSYWTYNTNNGLAGVESWYTSDPHYLLCNYSSLNDPGVISAKAYIPSPHSTQTNNGAKYYRWGNSSNYVIIGSVNQYSVFGWAYLSSVDWSQFDSFRLVDLTNDAVKYSKSVDLDAFYLECYFN